jgi:hypothetical protein
MLMIQRHHNIFNPASNRHINLADSTTQYQIIQLILIYFRNFEVTDYSVPSVRLTFVSVGQYAAFSSGNRGTEMSTSCGTVHTLIARHCLELRKLPISYQSKYAHNFLCSNQT